MKRALYIGRFNPLHFGHLKSIEYILKNEEDIDQLIIGIGSVQESFTLINPFTGGERFEFLINAMKEYEIPNDKFLIVPVPDLNSNSQWISYLLALLPKFDVIYSNNSLVSLLVENNKNIRVKPIPFFNRNEWSATNIRKKMLSKDETWKELVPISVKEYILHINGVARIQSLAKNDA
jgi:nicotinamide-nucleotide adenylyltransferase